MKNVLICEGATDLVFIQYFLEKTYGWKYIEKSKYSTMNLTNFNGVKSFKWFIRESDDKFLCIIAAGGSTRLPDQINKILMFNQMTMDKEQLFEKVILVTDNDEESTESEVLTELEELLEEKNIELSEKLQNNTWNTTNYSWLGELSDLHVLPLIIPFDQTGAIEDFLLEALKKDSIENDPDKAISHIVEECKSFINELDCKEQFLTKRRERTKARFSSVFVVLTPAEAFSERRNLLQSIPWEEYQEIQSSFKELALI